MHGVFSRQKLIFPAHKLIPAVGNAGRWVEQSSLPEENGFHLQNIVGMATKVIKVDALGEHLKGEAVESESQCPSQSQEACRVPVAVRIAQCLFYASCLALKAFYCQCLYPVCPPKRIYLRKSMGAPYLRIRTAEISKSPIEIFRELHPHLRYFSAVGTQYACVAVCHYVKNHIVVGWIVVMAVAVPVGGLHMDFDISSPSLSIHFHLGIEEVGARISVERTGIYDPHCATGFQWKSQPEHPVLPKQLKYLLHLKGIREAEIDGRIYGDGFHQVHIVAYFAAKVYEVVEHSAIMGSDFRRASPELDSRIK